MIHSKRNGRWGLGEHSENRLLIDLFFCVLQPGKVILPRPKPEGGAETEEQMV